MEVTDKTFDEEVIKSDLPVFIEFWASWCPPCKMMAPLLEELAISYQNRVKICSLNIDRNRVVALKYDIKALPTFIFFKNGKIIKRGVAAKSLGELKRIIEDSLNNI